MWLRQWCDAMCILLSLALLCLQLGSICRCANPLLDSPPWWRSRLDLSKTVVTPGLWSFQSVKISRCVPEEASFSLQAVVSRQNITRRQAQFQELPFALTNIHSDPLRELCLRLVLVWSSPPWSVPLAGNCWFCHHCDLHGLRDYRA